jgi:DNA-binding winged helix-turn-helix (wHTH) protein
LRLGSRTLDLLVARVGQVVGKEELIAAAWPGIFVEETGPRVHIAASRKAREESCTATGSFQERTVPLA